MKLDYSVVLAEWEKYFWKIHRIRVDFAGVNIPKAEDDEFPWFVCKPENFSTEQAYGGGKRQYSKWRWNKNPLDKELDLSFGRDGRQYPYIVRFRPNWEADESLKNISAETILKKEINTGTLKERLLLGDFLYWKYRGHLDMNNATLCSCSRCNDGDVPVVDWHDNRMSVYGDDSGLARGYLRSRLAVC